MVSRATPALRPKARSARSAKAPAGPPTAIALVDDPFEPGKKLGVVVSLRHDVLRQWHSRQAIDDAQFAAGRWFQGLFERAEIGGAGAIQYDKPKVDGGYPVDPLSEKVMRARQDLNRIAAALGAIDYPLVCRVIGEGAAIDLEARSGAWGEDRPERYIARRVRQALTVLAGSRGAEGPATARIRGWRAEDPTPSATGSS